MPDKHLKPELPDENAAPSAACCRVWAALSGVSLDEREAARIARALSGLVPQPVPRQPDPRSFEHVLQGLVRHD